MSNPQHLSPPFPLPDALFTQHLKSQHVSNERSLDEVSLSSYENNSNVSLNHVPGEPNISLTPTAVFAFLTEELATPLLDELYTKLWLVARKSGRSIDPLHKQKIKEREVIVTEEARLHLVWHHNKIYIKPIPLSLLYHDFWTTYLSSGGNKSSSSEASGFEFDPLSPLFDRSVALGFMRSYAFLVRHHSDYILARDTHLIPAKVDWARWSRFITHFHNIDDEEVARRYHYGQLRLSRLNWAVRLFRPRSASTIWFYEIPHWSIGMHMERALAPLLFGFGSLSLVLSSMQVALSVPIDELGLRVDSSSVIDIRRAFWVFSITVLLLSGVVWVLLCLIPFGVIVWQLSWGFKNRDRRKAKASAAA